MVDDERMQPGQWFGLVLGVSFNALALLVECQEGHLCRKNLSLIPKGSVPEQWRKASISCR